MKYADSFTHTFTHTAAETSYSAWFDISWANQIYGYTVHTFAVTRGSGKDETVTVSLQRYTPAATVAASGTDVLTFSTRTATATVEEKLGRYEYDHAAPGAENELGMRVRFESIAGGTTWTASQTLTIVCTLYAKRN